VLRDDFGLSSDIDFLVRFKAGRTPGLIAVGRIRQELAQLCNRRVDLVDRPTIERSRNYIRRKRILGSARVLYAT
jgi:predicted nucleotidyltransferase